jgi:hypothetical protein
LDNVTLVLGEPHDPRLPLHSVDLVLMVHMYHAGCPALWPSLQSPASASPRGARRRH